MRSRIKELVIVIGLAAVATSALQGYDHVAAPAIAAPVVSPSQSVALPLSVGDQVPQFRLEDTLGTASNYQPDGKPRLIVLTATGCAECVDRVKGADRIAHELASARDIPVWNLLVYQPTAGAQAFVQSHQPTADKILCDPQAEISVKTLGGSDQTCWILIDGQGRLAWRGPAEIDGLEKALKSLEG